MAGGVYTSMARMPTCMRRAREQLLLRGEDHARKSRGSAGCAASRSAVVAPSLNAAPGSRSLALPRAGRARILSKTAKGGSAPCSLAPSSSCSLLGVQGKLDCAVTESSTLQLILRGPGHVASEPWTKRVRVPARTDRTCTRWFKRKKKRSTDLLEKTTASEGSSQAAARPRLEEQAHVGGHGVLLALALRRLRHGRLARRHG